MTTKDPLFSESTQQFLLEYILAEVEDPQYATRIAPSPVGSEDALSATVLTGFEKATLND